MLLGLFDSGTGGLNTARYIKKHYPKADLVYIIDRENAPYGTKTEGELIKIAENNIRQLSDMGAEGILIACCTASTVYDRFADEYKRYTVPIIKPTADRARSSTRNGKIAVIATERTVCSGAFESELSDCDVYSFKVQELVRLIDSGLSDSTVTEESVGKLTELLMPALSCGADTLILGCTHFPSLYSTVCRIARRHGIRSVIDSSKEGANTLVKRYM